MTEPVTLRVFDTIGGPLCVSVSDGKRLYEKIAPLLIVLSFKQAPTVNAAVGQLYGRLSEDRVREFLSVRDLAADDLEVLRCVVDNAKLYFSRPVDFDRAWQEELGDEE